MSTSTITVDNPVYSEYTGDVHFADLLQFFAKAIDQKKITFRQLADAGNYDLLRAEAHKLKGSGAGYGFPKLSLLAAGLEAACCEESADNIDIACAELLNYLERICI